MRIGVALLIATAVMKAATQPVLVELFTSEGCSSCPPADFFLSHLLKDQPVPGVHVIALSEHVDYWNQLGWADPFSTRGYTERQGQYAQTLRDQGPYTPQMVVDGVTGLVGSDAHKALQVIAEAAKTPKANVTLECKAVPFSLDVHVDAAHDDADVLLAIAENGLSSNVARGENRGRSLAHDGVTRRLMVIGRARKQTAFTAEPRVGIENGWRRENLSAVVFLQGRSNHRVLGVGTIAISACGAD
jgi:hypothetical protein